MFAFLWLLCILISAVSVTIMYWKSGKWILSDHELMHNFNDRIWSRYRNISPLCAVIVSLNGNVRAANVQWRRACWISLSIRFVLFKHSIITRYLLLLCWDGSPIFKTTDKSEVFFMHKFDISVLESISLRSEFLRSRRN